MPNYLLFLGLRKVELKQVGIEQARTLSGLHSSLREKLRAIGATS